MKKITSIHLVNFQSHKDSVFNLSSGVNVLSGQSDNGKSSVLKGLHWLITNRPNSIGMISNWVKETNTKGEVVLKKDAVCSVSVTFIGDDDKEHTVERLRTKDKNAYVVDGTELEAVGTSVPQQVTDMLGMRECNIQTQYEPYFMLSLPSGQVASKLNELVHLDSIDKAFEFTKKGKLFASSEYKQWDGLASEHKLKADGLKHIPQLAKDIESLKEKQSEIDSLSAFVQSAEDCLNRYRELKENNPIVPNLEDCLEQIDRYLTNSEQVARQLDSMNSLLSEVQKYSDELERIPDTELDTEELKKLRTEIDRLGEERVALIKAESMYKAVMTELDECAKELAEVEKNLPNTCPVCGRKWSAETCL